MYSHAPVCATEPFHIPRVDVTQLYTGHDYDPATGQYFAPFRYLDPAIGRWVSADPIGMVDGTNRFAYVKNSPLRYWDRFGLASKAECKQLRARILGKAADLLDDLRRYDPVKDGQPGPNDGWKPGGHYQEIRERRQGLKRDITRYIEECIMPNGPGGPPGAPLPRTVDDMVNRPVPLPVFHSPSPLLQVPGTYDQLQNLGKICGVVGLAAGILATGGMLAGVGGGSCATACPGLALAL